MPKKKKEGFEQKLKRLEEIVEGLEEGESSLEESVKAFEEGIKLSKECQTELLETEGKVEILMKEGDEIKGKKVFQD